MPESSPSEPPTPDEARAPGTALVRRRSAELVLWSPLPTPAGMTAAVEPFVLDGDVEEPSTVVLRPVPSFVDGEVLAEMPVGTRPSESRRRVRRGMVGVGTAAAAVLMAAALMLPSQNQSAAAGSAPGIATVDVTPAPETPPTAEFSMGGSVPPLFAPTEVLAGGSGSGSSIPTLSPFDMGTSSGGGGGVSSPGASGGSLAAGAGGGPVPAGSGAGSGAATGSGAGSGAAAGGAGSGATGAGTGSTGNNSTGNNSTGNNSTGNNSTGGSSPGTAVPLIACPSTDGDGLLNGAEDRLDTLQISGCAAERLETVGGNRTEGPQAPNPGRVGRWTQVDSPVLVVGEDRALTLTATGSFRLSGGGAEARTYRIGRPDTPFPRGDPAAAAAITALAARTDTVVVVAYTRDTVMVVPASPSPAR